MLFEHRTSDIGHRTSNDRQQEKPWLSGSFALPETVPCEKIREGEASGEPGFETASPAEEITGPVRSQYWILVGWAVFFLMAFGAPVGAQDGDENERFLGSLWLDLQETSTLNGFVDVRGGVRMQDDWYEDDVSLGESRLQLEYEGEVGPLLLEVTGDLLYDAVETYHHVDLESGDGWFDLREAAVSFTPASFMDVKAGRQVLTWGTGDLLFINDLFPKDWNSFFTGRDEEYLKAPSDAMKASFFSEFLNLDVVYTPRFDANRSPDNQRLSQYNWVGDMRVGNNVEMDLEQPDGWFRDDEVALRFHRLVGGYECALYVYHGFWKDPKGFDTTEQEATYPDLSVVGGSVRGPVAKGIGNIEFGYYHSSDDQDGDDWLVPNSQVRFLLGYEQEVARDLTAGVQYYLEYMENYGDYERNLPTAYAEADRDRHVITLRLTQLLLQQTLAASVFAYWSPSDMDMYIRPQISYDVTDQLKVDVGGNVFLGEEQTTFFGQFDDNSNVYAGVRYAF